MLTEKYTLNNGVSIPKLGMGMWMIENSKAEKVVHDAVSLGYRHFDTAQDYGNEEGVGNGIRACGVPREDIFVNSKIIAGAKSYAEAIKTIDETLAKTGLDYMDMMIIHSPQPWTEFRTSNKYLSENIEVWRALENSYTSGKVKAIGVSNFLKEDLENILSHCSIKPMVNQILCHISNTPLELIDFCKTNDILVEAYSPIAHGEAMKVTAIQVMAQKYQVSVAQLCIRYILQLGCIALPKTSNIKHMETNASVDFQISEKDMTELMQLSAPFNYGEYGSFPVFSGKPLT